MLFWVANDTTDGLPRVIIATQLMVLIAEIIGSKRLTRRQEDELYRLLEDLSFTEAEKAALEELMEAIVNQEIQFLP